MPWNCTDNPTLRRRSRLKRTQPERPAPAPEDDDATITVLQALAPFPEARRAVIRALYAKLGRPDDYDDGPIPQ